MTDFTQDDRFDGLYLNVAQQARGIEPLLDTVFSFLRRKTDFFDGPTSAAASSSSPQHSEAAFEKVKQVFDKHAELYRRQQRQKQKDTKTTTTQKQTTTANKAKPTTTATAATTTTTAAAPPPTQETAVVEMGSDGGFDISASSSVSTSFNDSTTPVVSEPGTTSPPPLPSAQDTTTTATTAKDSSSPSVVCPPPLGNGGTVPGKYVWTQTLSEVTVTVPVPEGTRGRDLAVIMGKKHLSIGLGKNKGDKIIHAPLYKPIVMDDSFWTVEDGNRLVLTLTKSNTMEWWSTVCQGDVEIDIKTIQPESSKLDELDGETRKTVEKMMYDQRQKALGKPTSEQDEKIAMLEKFKQQHPELDFTNAKIN